MNTIEILKFIFHFILIQIVFITPNNETVVTFFTVIDIKLNTEDFSTQIPNIVIALAHDKSLSDDKPCTVVNVFRLKYKKNQKQKEFLWI